MAKKQQAVSEPTPTPTPEPTQEPTLPPEPTIVAAAARRPIAYDSFADLTNVPVERVVEWGGVATVTFGGVLSDQARQAVWSRMVSRNDEDQAAREALRQARDAAVVAPDSEAAVHALTLALLLADRELDGN